MSYISDKRETLEHLEEWAGNSKLLTSFVFFWAAGTPLQKSIQGFLRSIIFQILDHQPDLISEVTQQIKPFLGPEKGRTIIWTEKRLTKCLLALAHGASTDYRTCLFVDGLDEFNGDIDGLIELIQELVQIPNIKCCFSSRPGRMFEDFATSNTLTLEDLTHLDIQRFVESKLTQFPQIQNLSPEQTEAREKLKAIIVRKADGVFLWVDLIVKSQINGMKNDDSVETLRERLYSLPTEIEGLYSQMLARIEPVYLKEAASFLQTAKLLETSVYNGSEVEPNIFDFTVVSAGLTSTLRLSNNLSQSNISSKCSSVNQRIHVTCAGFLEVFEESKTQRHQELYEQWLSWEPEVVRSSYSGIDWASRRVQFCHRTARDFFEPDHEGGRFLSCHQTLLDNVALLKAAIYVARMTLWNIPHTDNYLWYHMSELMRYASLHNLQTPEDLTLSINLLDYFDRAIESLYRRFGTPGNAIQWHRRWIPKLRCLDEHGSPIDSKTAIVRISKSLARVEFLEVATYFGVHWYTQNALKKYELDIDADRAFQLAIYVVADPSRHFWHACLWKIETWAEIDILIHLLRLGADPDEGLSVSIWEAVLYFMYCTKLSTKVGNIDDSRFVTVIEGFRKAGANSCPSVFLSAYQVECLVDAELSSLEIDVSQLPPIANRMLFEDRPCRDQTASQQDLPIISNKTFRVWFSEFTDEYAALCKYMDYLKEEGLWENESMEDDKKVESDEAPQSSYPNDPYNEGFVMSDAEAQEL